MALAPNHKCIVCGKEYRACDFCEKERTFTPWRTLCDEFSCYRVYMDVKLYQKGEISKEEFAADMEKAGIDAEKRAELLPEVGALLDEILGPVGSTAKVEKKRK